MRNGTKKLVMMSLLCAIAYVVTVFGRIPVVMFLKYDPKDVIIAMGGFIYGGGAALAMSFAVSFIEMLTVGTSGPIGFIMNLISSAAFCCTAAIIYKMKKSVYGAVMGLLAGCAVATFAMLLWNYFLTPVYMGVPRAAVVPLLVPVILPFNVLKGLLNAGITMLIYKPLRMVMQKSGLLMTETVYGAKKIGVAVAAGSLLVIATCVMLMLVLNGYM